MKTKKVLSLGIATLMASSVVAPAFAAETQNIEVYHNAAAAPASRFTVENGNVVENMKIYEEGINSLKKVTVKSGTYSHEEQLNINGMTGTLPNGTTYTMSLVNSGDTAALYLTTSNVVDDMQITLQTDAAAYAIKGNSGRLNENNNFGEDGAPSCEVAGAENRVEGGQPMSLVFTPNTGSQVSKLNIRTGSSNQVNLVDAVTGSVTIDGKTYQINRMNDGRVSVSCQNVTSDVFVTALTIKAADQYNLSVSTDSHVTSDVTTQKIYSDTESKVVITPDEDYSVYKITIKDGENRKTLYAYEDGARIGSHEYKLVHNLNGQVEVLIPKAAADVSIEVTSVYGSFYVSLTNDNHINSNIKEVRWLGYGEDATVVLTPDDDYEITYVTVTVGDESVRVSANENRIKVNGQTYRMEKDTDGVVRLYLKDLKTNVQVEPTVRDTDITLTVRTDNGVSCEDSGEISVSSGDDYLLTFSPVSNYEIRRIKVTCGNEIYEATEDEDELLVDGVRCPIDWKSNGKAILKLYDINESMTITASSDYDGENRYITTRPDDHSDISHDANRESYAKRGEEVNLTITPELGYEVTSVKINTTKESVTLDSKTERFVLNDRAFYVTHELDGSWKINFSSLPSSIVVASETKKSDGATAGNIFTEQNPGVHGAYIAGTGNNMFAPDRSMTRAEAVVMLTRLYYGDSAKTGFVPSFTDTLPNAWYSSYLGWAQQQGLLDSNSFFRPNAAITRAEFLDLLFRFQRVEPTANTGSSAFSDLYGISARSAAEIAYATNHGWIFGYTDGTFRPNNTISRSEIVAMTNRVVNRVPDKAKIFANMSSLRVFTDVPASNWAFYDVMEACNAHYYTNNGVNGEQWS